MFVSSERVKHKARPPLLSIFVFVINHLIVSTNSGEINVKGRGVWLQLMLPRDFSPVS